MDFLALRTRALNMASDYLDEANGCESGRQAADWSLAAKNCASVALISAQAELSHMKAEQERPPTVRRAA